MTTSSNHRSPTPPTPVVGYWRELSNGLPASPLASLDRWFDDELLRLEERHELFVTPHSLRKNLRG